MKEKRLKAPGFTVVLIILAAGLILSVLASVTFGNADISIKNVYQVIICQISGGRWFTEFSSGAVHDVVWLIRLPRVLMAAAVGTGLSVCGCVMQAVVKNPLADPYVLGVSSGAYLGASGAVILGLGAVLGSNSMGIMAFAGAVLASFAVMAISGIGGSQSAARLVLSGMAISTICSAFANFLIYMANDRDAITQISYWSMGSLAPSDWDNMPVTLIIMILGTAIFWTQYRNLDLMLLGDETAVTLGTDLRRSRIAYMLLTAFMVGFAVCCAGMIGFVGLIIPHAMRMVFGTGHKHLIPLCALTGGIFLIWADVACRIILDYAELPIGILISLIGAPCFIYLMIRSAFGGGRK